MEKRTSAATRLVAALALIAAVLVVVVIASSALDGSGSGGKHHRRHQAAKEVKKQRTTAKTYTVETGDTLTAIAHRTGVPVAEILALNPEVDPQILIAGETLKLK
ncbi:MAG: LysM peptidoglycan-binding domain-containing protein [Solirubrobacterales bacterium]